MVWCYSQGFNILRVNVMPDAAEMKTLSPPQRFKRSLYQFAVRSVPQAQSWMDRSGGEPLPDVCRFLVHPCRFLVHRWISRLWLNLTAWNSKKPNANFIFSKKRSKCFTLKDPWNPWEWLCMLSFSLGITTTVAVDSDRVSLFSSRAVSSW